MIKQNKLIFKGNNLINSNPSALYFTKQQKHISKITPLDTQFIVNQHRHIVVKDNLHTS